VVYDIKKHVISTMMNGNKFSSEKFKKQNEAIEQLLNIQVKSSERIQK
jgi:hypothetical protein